MKNLTILLILAIRYLFSTMLLHADFPPPNGAGTIHLSQDSDSVTLNLIASTLHANECFDIVADNEYLYVIEERPGYSGQIKILDIHNPSNPFLYAATNIPNHPWTKHPYQGGNISKNQDYVIVSYEDWRTSHAHLATFDVSDPSLPVFLDTVYLANGDPWYMDSKDCIAFVFVYNYYQPNRSGIISVDFSVPQSLVKRDTILGEYLRFSLGEDFLYSYWEDSLSIYSFDSLGYVTYEGMYDLGSWRSIAGVHPVRDSFLFAINLDYQNMQNLLSIIDVSDPANPFLIAEDSLPYFGFYWADNVIGNDSTLFYAQDTLLCTMDISIPTSPTFLSACTFLSPCYSLFLRNDMLFSAHDMLGVQITDVADPSLPNTIGRYQTNGRVFGISLDYPFAYVAAGGLAIVNISNPYAPQTLGIYGRNLLKDAYDISASGNLVCVGSDNGIVIFDVSNPFVPLFKSYIPLFFTRRILAFDTLLFAANPNFHIINISNPSNPQILYSNDSLYISDFGMHNEFLYIAGVRDTIPSFIVYDIQDPINPQIIGDADIYQYPTSFAINDTFAYISNQTLSQVVNIADPSDPFIVSTFSLSDVYDMEIVGNRLFGIGRHENGSRGSVSVFDLMDPTIPHQIASTPTYGVGYYNKLSVRDNVMYCCNREGLAIYEFTETGISQKKPEEKWFSCLRISPNPFCSALHIQLSISNTQQEIKLQIFDVVGRLLRQHISSAKGNCSYIHFVWDGTDNHNRQVPAGTYFLKIQQGNNSFSKKIIRIK